MFQATNQISVQLEMPAPKPYLGIPSDLRADYTVP